MLRNTVNFGYLGHELRRRWGRTVVTALGLAAGVGLVMGIIGVSAGLTQAQNQVLSPLSSVGTDIIVTRTVGATTATSATPTPDPGNGGTVVIGGGAPGGGGGGGGGGFFAGGGGGGRGAAAATSQLNADDQAALLNANSSVLTDLSKLGAPGTKFVHDFFVPGTLITFPQDQTVQSINKVSGVESAVPGLSLQAIHESGTVPQQTDTVTTGGQTITSTQKPAPMTDAEQAAVQACIASKGGGTPPTPGGGGGDGGGTRRFGGAAFTACLPTRFQQYITNVVVPTQTITRVLNPPQTDTTTKSYTAGGVDPSNKTTGLVTAAQVTSGSWFSSQPDSDVLVNTAYASSNSIKAGQTLAINGTNYTVRGLVTPTLTGDVSDLYFDLNTLQTLSSNNSTSSSGPRINEVLVKVSNANNVDAVAAAIKNALPGAQVLTAKSLADQVTGSLANAQSLASTLGVAMAIIILLAAFLIAALLTTSSVSKRIREIGTLRAIGWKRGRIVRQIMAETVGIGLIGAVAGVLVGLGVAEAVNLFGPTLQSTVNGTAVGASTAGTLFHQTTQASSQQTIHMQAVIDAGTILLGVGCALLGGLLAGALGGWRASRLSPATALRDLG
jgi:ABC-type antimicrobial peptide transport system permease subunit